MLPFLLFMRRIKSHICLRYCCPRSKARKWRLSDCECIKKALAHLKSPLAFRWFLYNTDLQLNSVMVMPSHTYAQKHVSVDLNFDLPGVILPPFVCPPLRQSPFSMEREILCSTPLPLTQPPDLYSHFYSNHRKTPGRRSQNRKKSVHFHPSHCGFFFSLCVSGGAFVMVRWSASQSVFCFLNTEVLTALIIFGKIWFCLQMANHFDFITNRQKMSSSKT